jgi:glycerol-3-phosphate acyltransferase PlsX
MTLGVKNQYMEKLNYEVYGGTTVLGASAPVTIGHGASSAKAISYMIMETYRAHVNDLVKKFETSLLRN